MPPRSWVRALVLSGAILAAAPPGALAGPPQPLPGVAPAARFEVAGGIPGRSVAGMPTIQIGSIRDPGRSAARAGVVSGGFVQAYLVPQFESRLRPLGSHVAAPGFELEPAGSAWRTEVAERAERGAEKALRRAVKRYVLDHATLPLGHRDRARRDDAGDRDADVRATLGLGFAHGVPRLVVTRPVGRSRMQSSLDGHGRLTLDWGSAAGSGSRFGVALDPLGRAVAVSFDGSF